MGHHHDTSDPEDSGKPLMPTVEQIRQPGTITITGPNGEKLAVGRAERRALARSTIRARHRYIKTMRGDGS